MNKKIKIFPIALVSVFSLSIIPSLASSPIRADETIYHVDFYDNYLRENFELSSGYVGIGNNLLYKSVDVSANSLLTKPEDPSRQYYDFVGWFKEKECSNEWDFVNEVVNQNTRLYAKWKFSESEKIVEPEYTPPSTVLDESSPNDYELYSVMNFAINTATTPHTLKLPTAALSRLTIAAHDDSLLPEDERTNVLSLLEYKVKASKNLSASYVSGTSTLTIKCGENVETVKVSAKDYSDQPLDSNYENKALDYEERLAKGENENYHVMLAGSSSIEYWETSKSDLDPIVSYNHGIGGTTVEQWSEQLNERLVYPYKPKLVVYYVGINNVINSGQSVDQIDANLITLFDNTHAAMPNTKVIYILMNQLPGYRNYTSTINGVNQRVRDYKQSHSADWLTLINPGEALMKESNEPNSAYFRTDGLHLSNYGYEIWGGIIKETILEVLKNM